MKILVIGLDGVCQSVLDPMMETGVMPNLARVNEHCAVGPLESQLPPWTPSAWPSMYTGVNPGKHGVYDFLHFDGYDWDVVNRTHVKEFAVWELLSMAGFQSVVLNVPVTHPPRSFDGILVPGYVAPEQPECHPPEIWDELNDELGEYSLYASTLNSNSSEMESDLKRLTRMRGAAFRYLVQEYEPDFGFIQFQTTDTVFHEFPGEEDVIRKIFSVVDEELGMILDNSNADLTLIISDHGIGPIRGHEFRVNDFLSREGFVETHTGGNGIPSWKSVTDETSQDAHRVKLHSFLSMFFDRLSRIGITSQRIGSMLRHVGLDEWVLENVSVELVRAGAKQVSFETSVAYMRTRTEMGVRINLEGREPSGVVSSTEYEHTRSALIELFEGLETPDGDLLFEDVCPREEVFSGPYIEDAPDILMVPDRFDHFLVANLKGPLFGDPTEPWEHKRDGIIMAAGDGIDSSLDLTDAHLFDIAPTILAVFDLPVSNRMDGSPLQLVDQFERNTYPPFEKRETIPTDDSAVEQRLIDLGYLG